MIARARTKAARAGLDIAFETAFAESLPFADGTFDVVTSTVMLHHLRRAARQQALVEMRRVLAPGGRVLIVDFGRHASSTRGGLLSHFHRHGGVDLSDLTGLASDAGLTTVESGPLGYGRLQYVVGRAVK